MSESDLVEPSVNPIRRPSTPGPLGRLLVEDGGQDLVEYALLAAFIGIAGWAIVMTLPTVMGATYASWIDPNNGIPGQWDPPEPASAGS